MNIENIKNLISKTLFEFDYSDIEENDKSKNNSEIKDKVEENSNASIIENSNIIEPFNNDTEVETKSVFIDIDQSPMAEEETIEPEECKQIEIPIFVEPYEFKGIISPFYGVEKEKKKITKNTDIDPVMTEKKEHTVISPIFGYNEELANSKRENSKLLYIKTKNTTRKRNTKTKAA